MDIKDQYKIVVETLDSSINHGYYLNTEDVDLGIDLLYRCTGIDIDYMDFIKIVADYFNVTVSIEV